MEKNYLALVILVVLSYVHNSSSVPQYPYEPENNYANSDFFKTKTPDLPSSEQQPDPNQPTPSENRFPNMPGQFGSYLPGRFGQTLPGQYTPNNNPNPPETQYTPNNNLNPPENGQSNGDFNPNTFPSDTKLGGQAAPAGGFPYKEGMPNPFKPWLFPLQPPTKAGEPYKRPGGMFDKFPFANNGMPGGWPSGGNSGTPNNSSNQGAQSGSFEWQNPFQATPFGQMNPLNNGQADMNSSNNNYTNTNNTNNNMNNDSYNENSNATSEWNTTMTSSNTTSGANDTAPTTQTNATDVTDTSESLADFAFDAISKMLDKSKNSSESTEQPNPEFQGPPIEEYDCRKNIYLDAYCTDITTASWMHFTYDLSLHHIIQDMFNPTVLEDLKTCKDGSWCLPYGYHEAIKRSATAFYDVYCKNVSGWSMRQCLQKMKDENPDCTQPDVSLLYESVNLLCAMKEKDFMDDECYTRTKKSLYVLFEETRKDQELRQYESQSPCDNHRVEIAKTFLCADDACHFDQQDLLENFTPWRDMNIDTDAFAQQCNLNSSECQGQEYESDYYYYFGDYYNDDNTNGDYNNENYPDVSTGTYDDRMEEVIEQIMDTVEGSNNTPETEYKSTGEEFNANDRAVFLGLITAVLVLSVSFLVFLIVGIKRFRNRNEGALPVYTKLATDDEVASMRAELS